MNRIRFVGLHMLTLIVYSSLGHLSFSGDEGKEKARLVVREVIQSAIDRSMRRTADGSKIIVLPILTTKEEQERVRSFGENAVDALAAYAANDNGLQQMAAIRLLTLFRSDKSLAAFVQFAEHSRYRAFALEMMCIFPLEKTRAIYERFHTSDPDPEVREAAQDCLNSHKRK